MPFIILLCAFSHILFLGLHEQHIVWLREKRLLWDGCWWCGGGANLEWAWRRSHPHDKHSHHWSWDPGEQVWVFNSIIETLHSFITWKRYLKLIWYWRLRYPVILEQFSLRPGSGGKGIYHGGDGVIRKLQFRSPVVLSVLTERRSTQPYGLHGTFICKDIYICFHIFAYGFMHIHIIFGLSRR